jgi:hypothetical protein
MVDCAANVAKIILFIFNVILWLIGLAILVMGILVVVAMNKNYYDGSVLKVLGWLAIVIGVSIFVLGFCGCCGAINESLCLLKTYIVLLTIFLALSITLGIILAAKRDSIPGSLLDDLKEKIEIYPPPSVGTPEMSKKERIAKDFVDSIHHSFNCCGLEGDKEWLKRRFFLNSTVLSHKSFPVTCCKDAKVDTKYDSDVAKECYKTNTPNDKVNSKGCATPFRESIKRYIPYLIAFFFICGLVQACGIALTVCLCSAIQREKM